MSSSASVKDTAFLEAARSGDLRLIMKFCAEFEKGDIQRLDKIRDIKGRTALHFACAAGKSQICKCLVKRLKHDINAQDVHGETPLSYATLGEHLHIAKYLLDNGADTTKTNDKGFTALHNAAIHNDNVDLLQLLISRGADVNATSTLGPPLACAVKAENTKAVRVLLQNNANPNAAKYDFYAPLFLSSSASLEITDLLVKAGADPNIKLCGTTPLHLAVDEEKNDIIMYLLKAGANPNASDTMGLVPLEIAVFLGNLEAVAILFPVTSPIPEIPDWSITGIMRYVTSEEALEKLNRLRKQELDMTKTKALDALKKGDYHVAIFWLTGVITINPFDAVALANRSLCYARINIGCCALSDAKACVSLKPDWPMAHYSEGFAWKMLKNYHESLKSFSAALKLDPDSKDIRKALREAVGAEIAALRI